MKTRVFESLSALLYIVVVSAHGTVWALDEAVLTPTPERSAHGSSAMSKKDRTDADKEFNAAMSVWFKHRYADGEKLLGKFAAKYPATGGISA